MLVERIATLVGRDSVRLLDLGSGWPALTEIRIANGWLRVALHVGPVGTSHRGRDKAERRFQNPGKDCPVLSPVGVRPVLVGLWEEGSHPILVAADPWHRIGKATRQSIFMPLALLKHATTTGWAEQHNSHGEVLTAFLPALLPTFLEASEAQVALDPTQVTSLLDASGITADETEPPQERVRRASSRLVRSAAFSSEVLRAYDSRCAMCGFNFSLVQGAHIYPASAPASPDSVWNGIALCHNHHAAFDRHELFVEPESRRIRFHQRYLQATCTYPANRAFVEHTFGELREPATASHRPRAEMFHRRYAHFHGAYAWAE